MVERLRNQYLIRDANVLEAMRQVPRHFFVPEALRGRAYGTTHYQSMPIKLFLTVHRRAVTELLQLDKKNRVLEIGAGSGYQLRFWLSLRRRFTR